MSTSTNENASIVRTLLNLFGYIPVSLKKVVPVRRPFYRSIGQSARWPIRRPIRWSISLTPKDENNEKVAAEEV